MLQTPAELFYLAERDRGTRSGTPPVGIAESRTADVTADLEPPMDLPPITEMLWWNPRRTMDPAHAWLRARIAEIAAELDQAGPAA